MPPRPCHRFPVILVAVMAGVTVASACGRGAATPAASTRSATGSASARAANGIVRNAAAAPGFDLAAGVIPLGVISALTGPVAIVGEPFTAGEQVFFDALNARGGVAGRYRVDLRVEDNGYDQPTTIQKYQKLKDWVALFAQIFGTGQIKPVLPQLRADDVVAAPTSLDAEWVAEDHLLPLAASAQIAFVNAASWYVTEGGGAGRTICISRWTTPTATPVSRASKPGRLPPVSR